MDKIKLKYFISAARHLSFTRAAEDCHVVQGTISKQIAALESEIGVQLFDRKGQILELTPAGNKLFEDSNDYLEQYIAIERSIKRLQLMFDDLLNIGVGTMEHPLLVGPVEYLHRHYPGVDIVCNTYGYSRMASNFRKGTLDVGFCCDLCADSIAEMKRIPIHSGNWMIAAAKDHPFWQMGEEDRATLKNQTIISVLGDEFDAVYRHLLGDNSGFRHRNFLFTNAFVSAVALIGSGCGIGIFPNYFKPALQTLRMEPMLYHPLQVGFSCVYNPKKAKLPTIEKLLEYYTSSDNKSYANETDRQDTQKQ